MRILILSLMVFVSVFTALETKLLLIKHPKAILVSKQIVRVKTKKIKIKISHSKTNMLVFAAKVHKAFLRSRQVQLVKKVHLNKTTLLGITGGVVVLVLGVFLTRRRRPIVLKARDNLAQDSVSVADVDVNEILRKRREMAGNKSLVKDIPLLQHRKKYELTDDTLNFNGHLLRRIKALVNINGPQGQFVQAGNLGGYIESEVNLSHYRQSWVNEEAKVFDQAKISGNAWISGMAVVGDQARVYDSAIVNGTAELGGIVEVCGKAIVTSGICREGKFS